jgi:hypothetical protein
MDGGSSLEDCLTAVHAFAAAGVDILDISGALPVSTSRACRSKASFKM